MCSMLGPRRSRRQTKASAPRGTPAARRHFRVAFGRDGTARNDCDAQTAKHEGARSAGPRSAQRELLHARFPLLGDRQPFTASPTSPTIPTSRSRPAAASAPSASNRSAQRFGRISIRSAYRSPAVNDFGNKHNLNCGSNESNYAGHIWDRRDAQRRDRRLRDDHRPRLHPLLRADRPLGSTWPGGSTTTCPTTISSSSRSSRRSTRLEGHADRRHLLLHPAAEGLAGETQRSERAR